MSVYDYIKSHGGEGILKPSDIPALNEAEKRVFELMKDGNWHSVDEICRASGQREGLRRMRTLRQYGYTLEKRRTGAALCFEYRLKHA